MVTLHLYLSAAEYESILSVHMAAWTNYSGSQHINIPLYLCSAIYNYQVLQLTVSILRNWHKS